MKLWQVISAVVMFKTADYALVASILGSRYGTPPVLVVVGWLTFCVILWLLAKGIGEAFDNSINRFFDRFDRDEGTWSQ